MRSIIRYPNGAIKMAKRPKKRRKLPDRFQGAAVMRGLGMKSDRLDALIEREACDIFDATKTMYLVMDDKALDNPGYEVHAFTDQAVAIRVARAHANGNVDQRVLMVCKQMLIIATDNEL